jgi:type IV fimbrial biogenesis protein FimT
MHTMPRPTQVIDPRHQRGITLFEMLIVMAVAAILMAIAVPSYKYVTTSNRIAAEVNGLLGDLQFARSEAIKEGLTITVCISTDQLTCATGTTAWASGWIVKSPSLSTPLRAQPTFAGTDTLTPSTSIASIAFNREGFSTGTAGGAFLALHATPATAPSTRCLSISLVGLMSVLNYNQTDSNGNTCT